MRWADELPKRRVGEGRYPWREIALSGKVGVLVQGEDFDGRVQQPARAAYQWARANGYRVRTRTDRARGEFYVQFLGKQQEGE